MGAAVSRFISRFNEFQSLQAGESFSIRVTDFEAEEAAKEYLAENREQVSGLIRQAAGVSLEVSDPSIRFHPNEIVLSAKGGRGLLKVRASLSADVRWNGGLNVNVQSLELPFVSVTPQKLNSVVEGPSAANMPASELTATIIRFSKILAATSCHRQCPEMM